MTTATPQAPATAEPTANAYHFPEVLNVPIADIDRSRNHRVDRPGDEDRIKSLMETIKHDGQLQAVRVYEGPDLDSNGPAYILGFGWRRCEALERLGRKTVRAEVFPPTPDHDIEAARAVENLHRQDITPIEEAQAVADIVAAYQADHPAELRQAALEHAATGTGRSVKWVRDRDYFTRLGSAVRELANQVPLPAGHLRELAKVGDEALQLSIAMRSANAPYVEMKPGTLTPKFATYKKSWAEFLERARAGEIHVDRLRDVEQKVAAAQRQLGRVPWSLTLPVLGAGKAALPACDTCPSNTANDVTLFGVEDEGDIAAGVCMSPACFDAKTKASTQQREKLVKSLLKSKIAPTPAKINAKLEAAPGWLDGKRLKGFLQRETKKAQDPTTARGHANTAPGASSKPKKASKSTIGAALDRFDKALEAWKKDATDKVVAASLNDTTRRAGLLLFQFTRANEELHQGDIEVPAHWQRARGELTPSKPCEIDANAALMLDMIETGRPDQIIQIAAAPPTKGEPWMTDWLPCHPEFLTRLMHAMKIPAKNITPAPAWEDFAPKPAEPKAAPKKKATRKKAIKKKPVAKRAKKAGAK